VAEEEAKCQQTGEKVVISPCKVWEAEWINGLDKVALGYQGSARRGSSPRFVCLALQSYTFHFQPFADSDDIRLRHNIGLCVARFQVAFPDDF